MILYFEPFCRIGEFKLNSNIEEYIELYNFEYTPIDDITDWETYTLTDLGISLYIENEKIISILCSEECLYRGRNMIGMSIFEFKNFYDIVSTGEIDQLYVGEGEMQDVYEFDEIGLQLWCRENVIVTIISSDQE